MERFIHTLTSYEVKLVVLVALYSALILLGFIFIRKKKDRTSPAGNENNGDTGDIHTLFIRKWFAIAGIILAYTVLFILVAVLCIRIVTPTAGVRSVSPVTGTRNLQYDRPISVEFDVPVDTKKLHVNINPKIDVSVKASRYIPRLPYARWITISPKYSYPPGEKIMIYLSDMKNPFSRDYGSEQLIEYQTPPLPDVTSIKPENGAGNIPVTSEIKVNLSGNDTPQNIWDAVIEPAESFVIRRSKDANITIHFNGSLKQNTDYRILLYRTPANVDLPTKTVIPAGEKTKVLESSFMTLKAPLISSFIPGNDNVLPDTPIEIIFDEPMDSKTVESNFSLTPEVAEKDFTWKEGNTRLTIIHAEFQKDTEYTARFAGGIRSILGGTSASDISFSFSTVGKVQVANPTPSNTQSATVQTNIRIPFNQDVDHPDAQDKFYLSPETAGTFSWDGTTMIFTPEKPLKTATLYTYRIDKGVKSIRGLDSDQTYQYRFSTGPLEFSLAVPFYYQEELFTCNIAAARELLAYRGIYISEQQLKSDIGQNGTRGNGNPNLGYVANYGTYWDPIARGVGKYRQARVYKDWSLHELLTEVVKGNPVMIWGQNGWSDPHEISWTNPDGTHIYAINGMHSAVVRGFRGPIDNPTQILINDPWRGTYAIATGEFMRRWSYFKVAMVVD